jgi:hypothetical protein
MEGENSYNISNDIFYFILLIITIIRVLLKLIITIN